MASNYENLQGIHPVTLQATTAVGAFELVVVNASGIAAPPAAGAACFGIVRTIENSTLSDSAPFVGIATGGLLKLTAEGSTLAVGDGYAASTNGFATTLSTGVTRLGVVLEGTSSTASHEITVQFLPSGTIA